MYSRQTVRFQVKHFNGYKRSNYITDQRTSQEKNIIHRITPVGFGRIKNLREKGQIIYGPTFIYTFHALKSGKPIPHPYFYYMLRCMVIYQSLSCFQSQNLTFLLSQITKQISEGLSSYRKDNVKQFIQIIANDINDKLSKGQKAGILKMKRIDRLKAMRQWLLEQEIQVHENMRELLETDKANLGPSLADQKAFIFSPRFMAEQLAAIRAIQPLKLSQQMVRYKLFQKRHIEVFQAGVLTQRVRGYISYQFKVARLSAEAQPVLQRLSEFIDLRIQHIKDYLAQSANFIKDIFSQLLKYQNLTAKAGMKSQYIWLSPESVMVDQFSLYPRLHYEQPLLQAMGMSRKPESTQMRLCFQSTPRGPDLFRSLQELQQSVKLMLQDPFYGCVQLYESDKNAQLPLSDQMVIEKQRIELEQIKQKIVVWRFLLLSYFIRNGYQFGKLHNPKNNAATEQHFKSRLLMKQRAIKRNAAEALQEFLGPPNNRFIGSSFNGKLQELNVYLSIDTDDSVVKGHNFSKKNRYYRLRCLLSRQITSILSNPTAFHKILNVKKYVMMQLIAAVEAFEEAKDLVKCEREKAGERKNLRSQRQSQQNLKRQNFEYSKSIHDKIAGYTKREGADQSAAYLRQNGNYNFNLIEGIYNGLTELNILHQKLNQIQYRENVEVLRVNERHNYKELLDRIDIVAKSNLLKTRTILSQIFFVQIQMRNKEMLHKLPDHQPLTREAYQLLTKRLLMQVFTYYTLCEANFVLFESSLVPLLHLNDTGKTEKNGLNLAMTKDDIFREREDLSAVQEVVDYKSLLPKRLQYLKLAVSQPKEIERISDSIGAGKIKVDIKVDGEEERLY